MSGFVLLRLVSLLLAVVVVVVAVVATSVLTLPNVHRDGVTRKNLLCDLLEPRRNIKKERKKEREKIRGGLK